MWRRGRIAGRDDPELVEGLRRVLTDRGVSLREGVAVTRVEPGPALVLADGSRVAGSHLLVAVGRTPNLDALDLPAANVQASPRGVATDRGLRSVSNRRVYAVGDIADPAEIGPRAFTHVGSYHAGIVIRRLLFRLPAKIDYGALPRVTYTSPELAQTGLTESEAATQGLSIQVLRWPLADNDRAVAERDVTGMVKLVVPPEPRHRRRHSGTERWGDDQPLESGDRPAHVPFCSGGADRPIPDTVGSGETRNRHGFRATSFFGAHKDAGPPSVTLALSQCFTACRR